MVANPGSFEEWSQGKGVGYGKYAGQIVDEATVAKELQSDYQNALDLYNQDQSYLAAQLPQKGQSYTADQITQMTGSPLNTFNTYQGIPVATSRNPFVSTDVQGWDAQTQYIQNPDGTYRVANLGGVKPDVQVNAPKGSDWTDYMDMAITAAVLAGNAYVAPQALGAAFAPAGAAAGGMDAYMASAGLNPGTFEGAAFTLPEFSGVATQALPYTEAYDAANLYSQGLNSAAIEQNLIGTGLDPFLSADMASLAAQGLSPAQIEATLAASYTPAELTGTGIKSLNWGATQGLSAADALKYANTARQALGLGTSLSKLLGGVSSSGSSGMGTGGIGTLGTYGMGAGGMGTSGDAGTTNGIQNLTPGLTKGSQFKFANEPVFANTQTQMPAQAQPDYTQQILNAAQGGLVNHYAEGGEVPEAPSPFLKPELFRGRRFSPIGRFNSTQMPGYQPRQFADGGEVEGHNPQFFSEGGLNSLENTYVKGEGNGTSDSVPAMLANGEFVVPADVVSKLGNGSNDAGANVLDQFLATIREHAQKHDPKELPPDSKGPLAYLLDAKRKA